MKSVETIYLFCVNKRNELKMLKFIETFEDEKANLEEFAPLHMATEINAW